MVLIIRYYCRHCRGFVYWAYEEGKIHPSNQQGCPSENCNEVHVVKTGEFTIEELRDSDLADKIIGWEPGE